MRDLRKVNTERFKNELIEALNEVELMENGLIKKVTYNDFMDELKNHEPEDDVIIITPKFR